MSAVCGWGSVGFGTKEIMDRSSPDQGSWRMEVGRRSMFRVLAYC